MANKFNSETITNLGPDTYTATFVSLYFEDPRIIISTRNFSKRRLRTIYRQCWDNIYAKLY